MAELVDIFVPLDDADAPLGPAAERALGWARGSAGAVTVLRRSLDAPPGPAAGAPRSDPGRAGRGGG